MARLVSVNQRIVTGVMYPRGVYSRQVGIEIKVPAGVGEDGFNFTPVLGQQLWLLGIDFWAFGVELGVTLGGFISIAAGTTKPSSGFQIAAEWEKCMQYSGIKPMMYWWSQDTGHFHWSMNRYYSGGGRRFACGIQNFSADKDWWAWVFFEISEG